MILKGHSNAQVNSVNLITFRKISSAIYNLNESNQSLTGMILKAIDVETSKQFFYLELENRIGNENLFVERSENWSEIKSFTVNQIEEVGDPVNGFKYKILLNSP